MSTGVIGVFLPMERIAKGIAAAAEKLSNDDASLLAAAHGITTTDKGPKLAGREVVLAGKTRRITGFCKGAGMIGPNMATMLCLVMTDAPLAANDAQASLAAAAEQSFNNISVEGHTSTNDTALLLSSSAPGEKPLAGDDLAAFQKALSELCIELARMIPSDGEGASHLLEIHVRGCRTRNDARTIAKTVGESALVKTAAAGNDPNWGRIVSAAGYAGPKFDAAKVSLRVNGFDLYRQGARAVRRRRSFRLHESQLRDQDRTQLQRRRRRDHFLDQRPDDGIHSHQRRLPYVRSVASSAAPLRS